MSIEGIADSHRSRNCFVYCWLVQCTIAMTIVGTPANAAPGDLDPSFGSGGMVTTDFSGAFDKVEDLAIQPDGKIIAVGLADNFPNTGDFGLARYNPDGSLDLSFGSGGIVTTDFGGFEEIGSAAIQPDGKIVAVGRVLANSTSQFALARYKPDGSLDLTFSGDGKITTAFAGYAELGDVVLQPDGKIVVAGNVFNSPTGIGGFALARYSVDGTLDSSFGSGGKVTPNDVGIGIEAGGVILQSDGKIVVTGRANNPTTGSPDFAIVRFNPNGGLDPSFGVNGKVFTDFLGGSDEPGDIVLQPTGKIVIAGRAADSSGTNRFALARYNTDGTLDSVFGSGGKSTIEFSGLGEVNGLVLQADGKFVAAGHAHDSASGNSDFAIIRVNSNGTLDMEFGINGKVTTDFFGGADQQEAIVIQPNGKFVVAGNAFDTSTNNMDFALVRYFGDPVVAVAHFRCYKVKEITKLNPNPIVNLEDQFFVDEDVEVKKAKTICAPVDKNGEGVTNTETHLVCYDIKPKTKNAKVDVLVTNQFGEQELEVKKSELLCVPSTKVVIGQSSE